MLLSSASESTCFFLGALSDMPAVRAFALYAGMALVLDFFLQITVFVALLSLDMARQEARRYDVFCCIRSAKKTTGGGEGDAGGGASSAAGGEGTLYRVFKYLYAPFLMRPGMRAAVVVAFFGWFCASLAVVPDVAVGLDQEISMPDDSYVLKYFDHMKNYLSVGPPFYVVLDTKNIDYADEHTQNKICGSSGCDANSLQVKII